MSRTLGTSQEPGTLFNSALPPPHTISSIDSYPRNTFGLSCFEHEVPCGPKSARARLCCDQWSSESLPVHDMNLLCIVDCLSSLCNEPFWNIAGQISKRRERFEGLCHDLKCLSWEVTCVPPACQSLSPTTYRAGQGRAAGSRIPRLHALLAPSHLLPTWEAFPDLPQSWLWRDQKPRCS